MIIGSLENNSELTAFPTAASQQQQACVTGCETIGAATIVIGAAAGILQHEGAGAGHDTEYVNGAEHVGAATTQAGWQRFFCLQRSFFRSQPADAGLALIRTIMQTTIVQRE